MVAVSASAVAGSVCGCEGAGWVAWSDVVCCPGVVGFGSEATQPALCCVLSDLFGDAFVVAFVVVSTLVALVVEFCLAVAAAAVAGCGLPAG